MKKQPGFLELAELGIEAGVLAVSPCSYTFTRQEIVDFVKGKLDEHETEILRAKINSNTDCEKDARLVAQSEGVEDGFIERMGW